MKAAIHLLLAASALEALDVSAQPLVELGTQASAGLTILGAVG